eukprot:gene17074-23369_t
MVEMGDALAMYMVLSAHIERFENIGLACSCAEGTFVYLAGTTACGRSLSSDGRATSKSSLAYTLCAQYTAQKLIWIQYTAQKLIWIQYTAQKLIWIKNRLSEKIVARLFLKAFTQQATPIMDWSQINAANQTFYNTYVFDDRIPESPTRHLGIKPNCNKCTGYGTFDNTFQGKKPTQHLGTKPNCDKCTEYGTFGNIFYGKLPGSPVYDYHFDAMNTFRVIGYILYEVAGRTCPDLWDPANPREWEYGFYEDVLCKPIPVELTAVVPQNKSNSKAPG